MSSITRSGDRQSPRLEYGEGNISMFVRSVRRADDVCNLPARTKGLCAVAKTTLAGHPLHPQLIVAPAGLLPFSFIMDLMHALTGKRTYAEAAYLTMVGGSIGAVAAAGAGAADYFTIPADTPAKQSANVHASMNAGLLSLYTLNLLMRRGKNPPTGTVPVLLSAIGTVGLLISAWYGGHMVYEHGMRVKGVDPSAGAPEMRPPVDDQVVKPLAAAESATPS